MTLTRMKQGKPERLQMGQGRARSKRRKPDPISQTINQPSDVAQEIPGRTKIVTGKTNSIHSTNSANDRLINNNPFMPSKRLPEAAKSYSITELELCGDT